MQGDWLGGDGLVLPDTVSALGSEWRIVGTCGQQCYFPVLHEDTAVTGLTGRMTEALLFSQVVFA